MVIKKDKWLIKCFERLAEGSLTMNCSNVVLISKNYLFHPLECKENFKANNLLNKIPSVLP